MGLYLSHDVQRLCNLTVFAASRQRPPPMQGYNPERGLINLSPTGGGAKQGRGHGLIHLFSDVHGLVCRTPGRGLIHVFARNSA